MGTGPSRAGKKGTGGFTAHCHEPLTMTKWGAAQTPCDTSKAHPGNHADSSMGANTAGQDAEGQHRQSRLSPPEKPEKQKSMAEFATYPGTGLALHPATYRQGVKLSAPPFPSLHIPNPQGLTASTAADAEPWAIVHPINPTEWEKEQRRCWRSQEGHTSSCRNGLQGKSTNPAPSRDSGSDTGPWLAGRARALPWGC